MDDNKDALPTLDAKIVSDIVEAVMTSIKADSKASLKDLPSQTENDTHTLSEEYIAELYDLVHATRGEAQFYYMTVNEREAEAELIRLAYSLGQDDAEELRIALEEAESKLAQLEEAVTRPLEDPKEEKKRRDLLQSEVWKSAVEWVSLHGTEYVDLREMELANPFNPNKFPPTERGTVIVYSDDCTAISTFDGLTFLTLAYRESSDSWMGAEKDGGIWYVDTEDIEPGTWKVVE